MKTHALDLSCHDHLFHDKARAAFAAGDAGRFLLYANGNTVWLHVVARNMGALRQRGIYEAALLDAWAGTRTNNVEIPTWVLEDLFAHADRAVLRKLAPLPHAGPFTLYRGVAGHRPHRRVRGFSWTGSRDQAAWFARRFGLADPAVYRVTVGEEHVLAYSDDRQEDEYLVLLPPNVRPRRLPDAALQEGS